MLHVAFVEGEMILDGVSGNAVKGRDSKGECFVFHECGISG
jgi:hypothetical protein